MPRILVPTGFGLVLPTAILVISLSGAAAAATYDVANDAALQALLAREANNPIGRLRPGDDVTLHGGVSYSQLHIFAQATAAAPIRIHGVAGDPKGQPLISNALLFDASSHVTVDGLRITSCSTFPVFFANGASGNTLTNSDVSNAQCPPYETAGISVDQTAGPSNTISNNLIHDNIGAGLYVSDVHGGPSAGGTLPTGTRVFGNKIYGNGYQGIAVTGTYATVEYNLISRNGTAHVGTSGIQLYGGGYLKTPATGYAQYNTIRYNVIYGQSAHQYSADGNGIELDLYSTYNYVYFNEVHHNDGFGVVVYGAEKNWIVNNTIYQNGQCNFLADLAIGGTPELAARNPLSGGTPAQFSANAIGNVVANNLVSSAMTPPDPQPPCRGDNGAVATPRLPLSLDINAVSHDNAIGNQMIVPDQNGMIRAAITGSGATPFTTTIAAWNAVKPYASWPDLAADPRFLNAAATTATTGRSANLMLQPASPAAGAGLTEATAPFMPTCPGASTQTVDLWQGFANFTANPAAGTIDHPPTCNLDLTRLPIGAYGVAPAELRP